MNVYFTGDIHGNVYDLSDRFKRTPFHEDDIIIILGDTGFNYDTGKRADIIKTNAELAVPCSIFCVHGNHEARPETVCKYDRDICAQLGVKPKKLYHTESFCGGTVWCEDKHPRIKFAKDGERYTIADHTFLVIGGAYSVDKPYRLANGWNWFEDEQPSDSTKAKILEDAKKKPNVDFILSHTCALSDQPRDQFIPGFDQSSIDTTTEEFLQTVKETMTYRYWLFGHYHINRWISENTVCFYDGVLSLDQILNRNEGYE